MSLCSCFMLPTIWRTCWGRQIQEGSPSFVTCDLDCYGTKFQCDVGIICLLPFISTNLHPVSLQDGVFNHKVFNGEEYFNLFHCQNILNIIISEYQNIHWRISCLKFTGSEGSDSPSHSPVKVQSVKVSSSKKNSYFQQKGLSRLFLRIFGGIQSWLKPSLSSLMNFNVTEFAFFWALFMSSMRATSSSGNSSSLVTIMMIMIVTMMFLIMTMIFLMLTMGLMMMTMGLLILLVAHAIDVPLIVEQFPRGKRVKLVNLWSASSASVFTSC